jgi:lysophospholipid acyltransferase (LPLAT)-like uncharacterized protein
MIPLWETAMRPFHVWLTTRIYFFVLSAVYKSVRLQVVGEEHLHQLWSSGRQAIVCFFHGDVLLFFPHFRGRRALIFTTESKRGRFLTEIIGLFGYRPCMIPDIRGEHLAIDRMAAEILKGYSAVLVADGPVGPYHKVKHGAIVLSRRTGCPVVPMGVASSWHIVLKKRWDRYTLPLPFTRAAIVVGRPIFVPAGADREEIERCRQQVEEQLDDLNRSARSLLYRQGSFRAL